MWGRRLAIAGFCVAALSAVFATSAAACSCAELKPKQALRQADAVVVGRLIEVVPRGEYTSELRYEVKRTYKGGRAMVPGNAISVLVNGHRFLPRGGHPTSPLAATTSPHQWPSDLPA